MNKILEIFRSLRHGVRSVGISHAVKWREQDMIFVLCGFYCAVAVVMLALFGIEALFEGKASYGKTLLGFAVVTFIGYGVVWSSGRYFLASHLVAILMAALCLFLFYSGGSENTGVLWYFIYPLLAIFIQGIRTGLISVSALLVSTLLIS